MIEELARFSTCILADAIERLDVQLHNSGFTRPGLHYFGDRPGQTVVGYAATARIRTSDPPMTGLSFFRHTDWWTAIGQLPQPRIVVIEDIDTQPGSGASLGQVGASVFRGMHCVGAITNGSVRDLAPIAGMNFALFAGSLTPSHAYAHLVAHSCAVEIYGLSIQPGDLLAADRHGVLTIPQDSVAQICRIAADLEQRKNDFSVFCGRGPVSIEEMDNELRKLQS